VAAAGVVIFAALIVAAVLWRRPARSDDTTSRRRLAVPAVIFLAGLFSAAGAMTMFGEVPERYLYVPSIGLALLVGELVALAMSARHRLVRIVVPAVVGVVIVMGLVQLEQRLPDWRSDDTLWTAALRVDPLDPLANHYRAIAAGRRGDWDDALRAIEIATRGNPDSGRFATTSAWVLLRTGNAAAAVREAERATTIAPYQPDAWFYMAAAQHELSDYAAELASLEKLLQIAPDYPGAREAYEVAACEASGRKDCLEER
jgi:tetratricopeptide (TPR) repeat protein